MTDWPTYKNGEIVGASGLSKLIVKQLGCRLSKILRHTEGHRTKLIKVALALLGDKALPDKPHYKVYTNRIPSYLKTNDGGRFTPREWLYDLHWFTDPGGYRLTQLPLVVECEWRWKRGKEDKQKPKDPYGAVKFDFQKLLAAKADLKVLIFRKRPDKTDQNTNEQLDRYFQDTIDGYRYYADGSEFLFIAFDKEGLHYDVKNAKVARRKGQSRTRKARGRNVSKAAK